MRERTNGATVYAESDSLGAPPRRVDVRRTRRVLATRGYNARMPAGYLHYDVFTNEPLRGNQLAVFLDGRGLETPVMQAIAREMAFSETTFVLPPEDPDTLARVRIFTPGVELPMAGHPTIGTAFALAETGRIPPGTDRVVLGLGVGPTPVSLEWDGAAASEERPGGRLRFAWMTQRAAAFGPTVDDVQAVAAALGIRREDLAVDRPIQEVSCGVPYLLVPLKTREAVDRAVSDASALRRLGEATRVSAAVLLFTLDQRQPASPEDVAGPTVYSRMFAPQFGVAEDPATGSAAGPLGCYLVHHGLVTGEAARRVLNLQGYAMGRPSQIHIRVAASSGGIAHVEIGGAAVLVARGELALEL